MNYLPVVQQYPSLFLMPFRKQDTLSFSFISIHLLINLLITHNPPHVTPYSIVSYVLIVHCQSKPFKTPSLIFHSDLITVINVAILWKILVSNWLLQNTFTAPRHLGYSNFPAATNLPSSKHFLSCYFADDHKSKISPRCSLKFTPFH